MDKKCAQINLNRCWTKQIVFHKTIIINFSKVNIMLIMLPNATADKASLLRKGFTNIANIQQISTALTFLERVIQKSFTLSIWKLELEVRNHFWFSKMFRRLLLYNNLKEKQLSHIFDINPKKSSICTLVIKYSQWKW